MLRMYLDLFGVKNSSKDDFICKQWDKWVSINSSMQHQGLDQQILQKLKLLVESLSLVKRGSDPNLQWNQENFKTQLHYEGELRKDSDEELYQRYRDCLKKCKQNHPFAKVLDTKADKNH